MKFDIVLLFKSTRLHIYQRTMLLVILFIGLMQFPAYSQVTSKREVDYGKAIGELMNLGFPDAKGARYVYLNDETLQYHHRSFSSIMGGDNSPKLSGNGFYIPSDDNSKSGKLISTGGIIFGYSEKRSNSSRYGEAHVSGKLKDADLKKDLEVMHKWALEQSLNSSFSYNGTQYYSAAFSFANLAYQAGKKDEANELIKILFLNHENPEQIIDMLITVIASQEYNALYSEFTKKPDWEKYHAGLLRIQEKYPRGWDNQPGLSILIPLVKKRVDNEPVPFPSIAEHEFSDEIKKLLEQTAKPPKADNNEYYGNPGLFLINKMEKNTNAPAMHQLTQHGMDGFIALVSLIGDETLVVGNSGDQFSSSYHYSSSYGDDEGKSPETAYQSLNKPQTRGEVAEGLIRETLPHSYQLLSEMQGDQLKELAIEWWREHRKDDKFTLIKHYFEQGNESHVNQLAMTLIDENTEEGRKLFEETILNNPRPEQLTQLVQTYVKKRRAKAKDFLINYEKILLAKIGEMTNKEDNYSAYQIGEAGGTRKFIASLMLYTEELKPDVLFANLAKKGSDTESIMEMLGTVYEDDELTKVLSKFIHVAAQTDEANKRNAILEDLYNRIYYGNGALQVDGFSAPVIEAKTFSFTAEEKADWLKLLALNDGDGSYTNTNVIGMLLDKHLHPERTQEDYQILWSLGNDVLKEVIKARSLAFLEGRKAEPLPNMNLVPDDKKKKILEELEVVSAANFREMYVALNYSERLLVQNDPASRAKFQEANVFIKGIEVKHTKEQDKIANIEQLKEVLKPILDKKVGAETYKELANIIVSNLPLFEGVAVSPQLSMTLPSRDIYLTKSSMLYFPELDIAIADLVAGKREDFVVMVAKLDPRSRGASGQQPQIFILDKGTPADPKKLEEVSDAHNVTVVPVTKKVIEDWKKNQGEGKEKIINELIQIQPSLIDMRARLLEMELEDLEAALEEMKGNQ